MDNLKNQILIKKIEELYEFYLLKTVNWKKGLEGHEVCSFIILPSKRFKITPNHDFFLLTQPNESLDLCLQFRNRGEIKQKNYQFTKLPFAH